MSAREPLQANANRAADGSRDARALLATCVAAAVKGADAVRSHGQHLETLAWEEKSRADYVTAADRDSEHAIREVITARHRDAVVLGEELSPEVAAATLKTGLVFVVDPLDGTTNFLHGFPWYAVSIAAMGDGVLVASAILNIANGDLFTAVAGGGARRSGQPIHVSKITEPIRSLFATGFPFKQADQVGQYLRGFGAVMKEAAGVRRVGAASLDLADVACGRYEAFWELSLAPWDVAAGILLVREAGGVVTDLEGRAAQITHTSIVAGNPRMQAWLLEMIGARG